MALADYVRNITAGFFGRSSAVVKSGPTVITGSHPIFGGVKNIFPANHETVGTPLPASRHVFGSGVPVHSPFSGGAFQHTGVTRTNAVSKPGRIIKSSPVGAPKVRVL